MIVEGTETLTLTSDLERIIPLPDLKDFTELHLQWSNSTPGALSCIAALRSDVGGVKTQVPFAHTGGSTSAQVFTAPVTTGAEIRLSFGGPGSATFADCSYRLTGQLAG